MKPLHILLSSILLLAVFAFQAQQVQNLNDFQHAETDLQLLRDTPYDEISSFSFQLEINSVQKDFILQPNFLLSDELQEEYPDLKTFDVFYPGSDMISGKMTIDLNNFYILLETKEFGLVNISPSDLSGPILKSEENHLHHSCGMIEDYSHQDPHFHEQTSQRDVESLSFGTHMRNYDLVVVATGEFTTLNGGVSNAMTVLTNSVNTVNLMFEKDVAVHMNLVGTQLYPDPATDPLTPDNQGGDSRTNQASEVVALNWSDNEYDVGHVFHRSSGGDGWSGGGVAGLGVVCSNSTFFSNENPSDGLSGPIKAAGWSGSFNNTSNGWYQLAAHEFGHMYNAPHTFNGSGGSCSGNISSTSSFEIGSGTTIMSYQGICSGSQNIPGSGSDDNYFHSTSIDRMNTYVSNSSGSCSNDVSSGNTPPTVNANPGGASYIIPGSTPFELEGTASDADGDDLLFNWEQIDEDGGGTPTQGFLGATAGASSIAPLFRSYPPSSDIKRVFPSLSNILAGNNNGITFEALPTVDRFMDFVLLARDCNSAAGGVATDDITIEVDGDTGPFEITAFNSGTNNWFANGVTTVNVTWDVAGTDQAPVNCSTVDIWFSTDNGENFDFLLESGIVNDGQHDLLIPNLTSTEGRLKIKCSNNIFFDINDAIIDIATGCGAQVHTISPASSVTADAGDAALNLGLIEDSSPAPGHSHNFVIVNDADGTITEISSSADLSDPITYPQGNFVVYGVEFEDNVDLSPYVGGAFTTLESDALAQTVCAALSTNNVNVTIIFIGCQDPCWTEFGSSLPCATFIDTDSDGTCDANDGCPNDPNKIAPGDCGCGNPDTDTDLDGTADCIDECPNDPLDFCGPCTNVCYAENGTSASCATFVDADNDGTCDAEDECPTDPDKILAGQCGCFTPETDTDSDGTADCNDNCPNDPNKTEPGDCGCGFPEANIQANAGQNETLCDTDFFDLIGNIPSAGTTTWSIVSGPGSIVNPGATTTNIVSVTPGSTTIVQYEISNGNCFSSDQVTVQNDEGVVADAGDDVEACNLSGDLNLNAVPTSVGTGVWQLISGVASLGSTNTPSTTLGVPIGGEAEVMWSVFNGVCLDRDTVRGANFALVETTADAGPAQVNNCNDMEFVLTGNDPVNPNYNVSWSEVVGDGQFQNGITDQQSIVYENVPVGGFGFLTYTISNGPCTSSDNIVVLNDELISAEAGPDISQCGDSFTMSATSPSSGSGEWTVESGTATIDTPSSPTSSVTVSSSSAMLKWTVTNSSCVDEDLVNLVTDDCGGGSCNDPCFAENGTNQNCSTFLDADADGTCDANDGCPNDPNKIAPGDCGCGVADTDSDSDGTADCNDGCPNDPNKIAPGVCGCGVADTDSDSDGTLDCNDGCPNDPNKIAPGECGCGVTDTDSDSDGTADCNDDCPNDPDKIAPGDCGCGVADTDSDSDGTADCNDDCPNDPNKIAPGDCGCGVADTDSDSDGTADCNDDCPNDPNKTAPGDCGCGVADTDSDSDGIADCNDGCPNDPNKIAPGDCGCGVADTDSDSDGTADCNDGCPNDPNKVAPGDCGCGVADTDSDSDGTADCNDGCPNDPNKVAPGECGCGVADTDSDSDGTADCNDDCPNDPNNNCNVEICDDGIDNDGDGFIDCDDFDCSGDVACAVEICDDGIDNDGDGFIDCDDFDCSGDVACAVEICDDGIDNDGDGFVDCDDFDCSGNIACAVEICDDGIDNDGDGFVDCDDFDCSGNVACAVEICDDGIDNDGDGFVDCDDTDCSGDPSCAVEICDDGIDNDGDGFVDCDDADCSGDASCQDPTACESFNFVNAPTGLIVDQSSGNSTQLFWDHYSDASDGCILQGVTIESLDLNAPTTGGVGNVLVQGSQINGLPNGLDNSAPLPPNATYELFDVNSFPNGPTNNLIPEAFYKWRVRCGCVVDVTLPLPDRLALSNLHLSPWSGYSLFENLGLPSSQDPFEQGDQKIIQVEDLKFNIYPNPFDGLINVVANSEIERIHLLDASGRLVFGQDMKLTNDKRQLEINAQSFESGIYFLNIATKQGVYTQRLVKY